MISKLALLEFVYRLSLFFHHTRKAGPLLIAHDGVETHLAQTVLLKGIDKQRDFKSVSAATVIPRNAYKSYIIFLFNTRQHNTFLCFSRLI